MNVTRSAAHVMVLLLLATTACAALSPSEVQTPTTPMTAMAVRQPSPPSTTSQTAIPGEIQPTVAPTVISSQPTVTSTATDGVYVINQRATSTHSTLKTFNLVLYRATLTGDHLILRVGFHNAGEKRFYLAALRTGDLRLVDASGNEYQPITFSANLNHINPSNNGFLPGQANVGDVTFPAPTGPAPYELRFPLYHPIAFQLDQPAPPAVLSVPEGTYPINIELYSPIKVLAPIHLRLDSIMVTQQELIVQLAFVNTLRKGYNLGKVLEWSDARLLDAEFAAYKPIGVSDSLAENIAPPKGWLPGQAHVGQITFPRPERMEELRFIFPEYAAATLYFNETGLANATITSAAGGAPPPTATPTTEQLALHELEKLLERQAKALLTDDLTAYLATFAEALHQEQQTIFERSRKMPLSDYQLSISPTTVLILSDLERGRPLDVTIFIRYRLRGIPKDNPFEHMVKATFEQQNGEWIISAYKLEQPPPFWWSSDVLVQETPHFLIITRPDAGNTLNDVAQECEQAYRDIQAAGLEVETRLVAYLTTTQEDFRAQTGMGSRTLGAAWSQYEIANEQLQSIGRAFYINGEAFKDQSDDGGPDGRLATIRHELVHLALAHETRPFTPIWLVEGAAMYYAGQLVPDFRHRLVTDGKLNSLNLEQLTGADSLGAYDLFGQLVGYEYIFSGETVRYLLDTYGADAFWEFYRSFSHVPIERVIDQIPLFSVGFGSQFGNLSRETTQEALLNIYGLTIADLDAAVKLRLREQ
ncbi:hypothetical protein [Chloroflexus sp.]|uniref:hypothetical protein n=1 Tax=Chloroflexus sp. TaxID=1904827 RepID=UPI00404B00F2